jgi:hypothetical protein
MKSKGPSVCCSEPRRDANPSHYKCVSHVETEERSEVMQTRRCAVGTFDSNIRHCLDAMYRRYMNAQVHYHSLSQANQMDDWEEGTGAAWSTGGVAARSCGVARRACRVSIRIGRNRRVAFIPYVQDQPGLISYQY